ncbi:hypothetical protein AMTR_s02587p00002560 [Amborella trichopoda]|uniref:Uncharacterized protein n=1 Tax=Amborella trichopoda TaxID=13333 RepID=U5CXX8_AMBTC|nr:hypothetical protein AMTR_s02587p00002560 [Amborella trichopoda]
MGSTNISYILRVKVDRVLNSALLHRSMYFNFIVTEWMDVRNIMESEEILLRTLMGVHNLATGAASHRELQTMDSVNYFICEKLLEAQAPWQVIPNLCSEITHFVCVEAYCFCGPHGLELNVFVDFSRDNEEIESVVFVDFSRDNEEIESAEHDFYEAETEIEASEQEGDVIGQTDDPKFLRVLEDSS